MQIIWLLLLLLFFTWKSVAFKSLRSIYRIISHIQSFVTFCCENWRLFERFPDCIFRQILGFCWSNRDWVGWRFMERWLKPIKTINSDWFNRWLEMFVVAYFFLQRPESSFGPKTSILGARAFTQSLDSQTTPTSMYDINSTEIFFYLVSSLERVYRCR